jgi:hypothetical protein
MCKGEHNTKHDCREIKGYDREWIYLTQVRDQNLVLIKKVIILLVSQRAENALTV